jgi:ABC-type Zn uptake system ZnuABC Zn-binding protein ZnuA
VLGDLVQQVGGEAIRLHTLVGPDGDSHTYEPSPADGVALHHAQLVFEIGLAFEPWLAPLFLASGSSATRVVVSNRLALLRVPARHPPERPAGTEQAHEVDPHVWFDIHNVIQMVADIRDALIRTQPTSAATYQHNAAQYTAALQELDAWVMAQVQTVPPARRKLVTSHATLGYFARRYGFDIVGTALTAYGTEVADPSAGALARLVEQVKMLGIPVLFAETSFSPRLMQRLAAAAGVRLAPPLYTDTLGPPGSAGETYLAMMRANVTTIVEALRP